MRRGITVAGSLLADVFYNAPTYPKEGMLIQAKSSGISVGGTGNIILDLARLDPTLEVTVSARLGEDGIASARAQIAFDLFRRNGHRPASSMPRRLAMMRSATSGRFMV